MADTPNLGGMLIGALILVCVCLSLGIVYVGFTSSYGVQYTNDPFVTSSSYKAITNITDTMSQNLRDTGIQNEDSQSKIISVGWNSWKLFLQLPGIISGFTSSVAILVPLNVAGIDWWVIALTIVVIWVLWGLIYALFFGRG